MKPSHTRSHNYTAITEWEVDREKENQKSESVQGIKLTFFEPILIKIHAHVLMIWSVFLEIHSAYSATAWYKFAKKPE